MNILLLGAGGREHALAWALNKSPQLKKLYCAPGNGGMATIAECIALNGEEHSQIIAFCQEKHIDLVIIGPEAPLVSGLADALEAEQIAVFGPSKAAALLEGSKSFTKDLCAEFNIPTASYHSCNSEQAALSALENHTIPVVIKADGLAAGKGVVIAQTRAEAEDAVKDCFSGKFGDAGASVVIEEFLQGEEASFFALSDGTTALPLVTAQDHKRAFDGDTGPNTGGMGAYSPAPIMSNELIQQTMERIIYPTIEAMAQRGTPFKGVLYAGLMITDKGPELIEYNVRFGDPECQVLMMRLKSDLAALLLATAKGELASEQADWHEDVALTVVMAAKGYPGSYEKNTLIRNLDQAALAPEIEVFHAGTRAEDGQLFATGGRVLNITARGATVSQAQQRAYDAIEKINWPEGFYRTDIGWRAVERERGE